MVRNIFSATAFVLLLSTFAAAQTGQWQTINSSSSPTARHECSYARVGSKFYLIGGRLTKPVQVYDPAANSWTTETSPPFQMHHFQAVEYHGKIYVMGAMTGNCCHETPIANIYIYDPVAKTWNIGPLIPADRRRGGAGCVLYNDKLYLVCGIIDGHTSGWVNWMDSYDLITNTWTQLADAPHQRDHFQAALVNGKIYAIGGRRTGFNGDLFKYTIPEVDVYDIATNTWTTLPASSNIPTQRSASPTAVIGDEIIVAGGEGAQVAYATTEAFNVVTKTWRTLDALNQSRHATSAVLYNNEIYVACGAGSRGGSNELNSQEKFSFSTVDCNGVANGTATLDGCGICSGGNTGHVADSDKDSCGVCFGNGSSCVGGCQPLQVTQFMLVREGTGGDIGPLTEGMTINLATMPKFSIRADVCSTAVKSVKFILNGATFRTESTVPYSLNGDNSGSYIAWNPAVGAKTLTGTPYSQGGAGGTTGISLTVHFNVVNQAGTTVDCNGVTNGTAHLNSCGICVGGNTGLGENQGKDCNGVCNGTATLDGCGVCSGGNTGHVANSDKDACGVCFGNGSSCGGCQPLQVTQFMLVHEGTGGDIGPLTEGMTINLATMPKFSIRADVCSTAVKSVKFVLNGSTFRTESSIPYALNGDNAGSYTAWNATVGAKTLAATPYSQGSAGGTAGIALTRHFTVVNSTAKTDELEAERESTDILSVYPNPFSSSVTVEFYIPETTHVRSEMLTMEGKLVSTLFDAEAEGGTLYQQTFEPETLPNGMYFLRFMTASGESQMKKLMLMR